MSHLLFGTELLAGCISSASQSTFHPPKAYMKMNFRFNVIQFSPVIKKVWLNIKLVGYVQTFIPKQFSLTQTILCAAAMLLVLIPKTVFIITIMCTCGFQNPQETRKWTSFSTVATVNHRTLHVGNSEWTNSNQLFWNRKLSCKTEGKSTQTSGLDSVFVKPPLWNWPQEKFNNWYFSNRSRQGYSRRWGWRIHHLTGCGRWTLSGGFGEVSWP